MGTSRRSWFAIVRERFSRPSPRETIIVLHTNNTISASFSEEDATTREEDLNTQTIQLQNPIAFSSSSTQKEFLSEEHIAAIKIQAHFRGHLARRAFRAQKSLVKLQAIVRGVCVRRLARIASHCMHAVARLQVNVRGRQLLSRCSHG